MLREQYRQCLKSIDQELSQRASADQQRQRRLDQAERRAQQQAQEQIPSPEARYSHCRLVQDRVIAAEAERIEALSLALLANRKFGPESSEAATAQARLESAIATLEELIPTPMRAGKDLLPDAVATFQRCRAADFNP